MKNSFKKIISVLCVVAMLSTFACFAASAANSCEHVYGEYVVTDAANCAKTGTEVKTCSKCGVMKSRVIERTPCDPSDKVFVEEVPADCCRTGMTAYSFCKVCSKYYDAPEVIPTTKHITEEFVYVEPEIGPDGEIINEDDRVFRHPTCTKEGLALLPCSYTYKVEKLDEDGNPVKDEAGNVVMVDKYCFHLTEEPIDKLPHMDEDGNHVCDVCGFIENEKPVACDNKDGTCFCHYDTIFSKLARFINTTLNRLLNLSPNEGLYFSCCGDMVPFGEEEKF